MLVRIIRQIVSRVCAADMTQTIEGIPEQRTVPWMERLVTECRESLRGRVIAQHPGFAAAVVLSLAIGISCAAGVFAIVESARYGPLPFANGERIEHLYSWSRTRPGERYWGLSPAVAAALAGTNSPVAEVASVRLYTLQVRHDDRTSRPWAAHVTNNFASMLGARAALGRLFDASDAGTPAVVLSYDYWRSEFASDTSVIGRVIYVLGVPRVVIGVATKGARFAEAQLWLSGLVPSAGQGELIVLAALRPGVPREEARPIIAALGTAAARDGTRRTATMQIASTELREFMLGGSLKSVVLLLTIIAVFVGLLAAVNFAALMLARGIRRRGEIGVRAALGASVSQLARHIIGECVLLCLLGGALGANFAPAVISVLGTGLANALPQWLHIVVGWRTIGASVLLALGIGIVFGLGPAFDIARPALASFLRSASGTTSDAGRLAHTRSRLVAIQVALATGVLIALGSIVGRALLPGKADPGFDYAPVVRGYLRDSDNPSRRLTLGRKMENVLFEARQTPGVAAAGYREEQYLKPNAVSGVETTAEDAGLSKVWIQRVGDQFFDVIKPRVVAGRLATDDEIKRGEPVAVITKSLASDLYDGVAVGKSLGFNGRGSRGFTVVGVIDDVHDHPYSVENEGSVFISRASTLLEGAGMASGVEIWIRTTTPGPGALRTLRSHLTVARLSGLEVAELDALSNVLRRELESFREVARVFVAIFAVALLLAAFGIYGLAAYTAEMRSREFAIREALGATRAHIAGRVLRGAFVQAAIGLTAGAMLSTLIIEHLNDYQLKLSAAFAASVAAIVVVGLMVLIASIGPVSSAWRRDLSATLRAN